MPVVTRDGDAPACVAEIDVPRRFDFDETLRFQRMGGLDPTCQKARGSFWKAARTPAGAVTLHLARPTAAPLVVARAWGPGARWTLDRVPGLLGLDDAPGDFVPGEPLVRLARRYAGLHLSRTPWPLDALWGVILEQRVRFADAARAYRRLVTLAGEPAPGPPGLLVGPSADALLNLPTDAWRRAGVDGHRALAMRHAARLARLIEAAADLDLAQVRARLSRVRGCGPWTVEMTMGMHLGDPDAVPLGDCHMPHLVAWALAGETRGTDARMLELLDPYRGHRFRVIRLLFAARIDAPRRGPGPAWTRAAS